MAEETQSVAASSLPFHSQLAHDRAQLLHLGSGLGDEVDEVIQAPGVDERRRLLGPPLDAVDQRSQLAPGARASGNRRLGCVRLDLGREPPGSSLRCGIRQFGDVRRRGRSRRGSWLERPRRVYGGGGFGVRRLTACVRFRNDGSRVRGGDIGKLDVGYQLAQFGEGFVVLDGGRYRVGIGRTRHGFCELLQGCGELRAPLHLALLDPAPDLLDQLTAHRDRVVPEDARRSLDRVTLAHHGPGDVLVDRAVAHRTRPDHEPP